MLLKRPCTHAHFRLVGQLLQSLNIYLLKHFLARCLPEHNARALFETTSVHRSLTLLRTRSRVSVLGRIHVDDFHCSGLVCCPFVDVQARMLSCTHALFHAQSRLLDTCVIFSSLVLLLCKNALKSKALNLPSLSVSICSKILRNLFAELTLQTTDALGAFAACLQTMFAFKLLVLLSSQCIQMAAGTRIAGIFLTCTVCQLMSQCTCCKCEP